MIYIRKEWEVWIEKEALSIGWNRYNQIRM